MNIRTLLFTVILFQWFSVFSQEEPYYEYVSIKLLNSEYKQVTNATVFVDETRIPYDSSKQSYFLLDGFKLFLHVKVYCDGYDTLEYNKFYLTGYGNGYLMLKRPSEKYYYPSDDWRKMPYKSYPNRLLVILNSSSIPKNDSLKIQFEHEINQHGLKIDHSFIEIPTDPTELWRYRSYSEIGYRIVIQKEDESDFDSNYCKELAYLRSLEMVRVAGPLIQQGDKFNLITYNNTIYIRNPSYLAKDLNVLVKQIDERFYYDDTLRKIILPLETNEMVPQIMEKLKAMGVTESMNMVVFFNVILD